MTSEILKIFEDESYLWALFLVLTIPMMVFFFFLTGNGHHCVCEMTLVLPFLCTLGCGRLQLVLTLSLLQAEKTSSLSLSPCKPLTMWVTLLWPVCQSHLSYWGWQNWGQDSTYLHKNVKKREITIFPSCLTIHLLMQHSNLLAFLISGMHFCLIFNLFSDMFFLQNHYPAS